MGLVNRFDIYLINLDPTVGSEIQKTRPCVIISPNAINHNVNTVIIAPLTSKGKLYPTRVLCTFQKKQGLVVLDQLRTVDKIRLVKNLGQLDKASSKTVLDVLAKLFAP